MPLKWNGLLKVECLELVVNCQIFVWKVGEDFVKKKKNPFSLIQKALFLLNAQFTELLPIFCFCMCFCLSLGVIWQQLSKCKVCM